MASIWHNRKIWHIKNIYTPIFLLYIYFLLYIFIFSIIYTIEIYIFIYIYFLLYIFLFFYYIYFYYMYIQLQISCEKELLEIQSSQLFCRMFLNLRASEVSSWSNSGNALLAGVQQRWCHFFLLKASYRETQPVHLSHSLWY